MRMRKPGELVLHARHEIKPQNGYIERPTHRVFVCNGAKLRMQNAYCGDPNRFEQIDVCIGRTTQY